MNAIPSPGRHPHDVESCDCHPCQLFRYQRQYGPAPGQAPRSVPGGGAVPPPPAGPPPGVAPGYGPPPPGVVPGYGPTPPGYGPTPPGYAPGSAAPAGGGASERTLAAVAHWSPLLVAFLALLLFPLMWPLCCLPPLILMTTAKTEHLRDQAREALNWQLTALIAAVVCYLVTLAAGAVGMVLSLLLFVGCLILQVMAADAAGRGERHRYPACIRFVNAPPAGR
ncbi:DUF4870 domain-containing protein [Streptomyces sp. NPDC058391]|uniref:DUF4870 domain-containing protein n=1 Tax=Streptomyces sp. NPDC058391 TaxID=3346476 RepID=UPI003659634C